MELKTVIRWDEEAREDYRKNTEKIGWKEIIEEESIKEKWGKLKEIIGKALVKRQVKIKKKELGHKNWWDRSCTKGKRKIKRAFMKWKEGKKDKEEYWAIRKKWKELLEEKRKKKKEEEEKDLRSIRNEAEA